MDEGELKSYRRAGEIAKSVREWSRESVTPGKKALDLANEIEAKIRELGGDLAFPLNVCVNDVTAHHTPKYDDGMVLGEKDVVSVDLGVHVDGFIADTAYTLDFSGEYGKLLEANELALEESLKLIRPGLSVSEVGGLVHSTLTAAGFKPIENLTGHEMQQYDLHAGLSVPNIPVPYDWEVEEGMVLALEPFATDGYGRVVESKTTEIYSVLESKPTRMREARVLLKELEKRRGLPFAARWFTWKMNPMKLGLVLLDLLSREILKSYPTLHEQERGVVSQFEHTVIVTEDGCEVITR